MLLALVLFFITGVNEATFLPICLTMTFCFLIFLFAVIRLLKDGENPLEKKKALIAIIIYLLIISISILIKIFLG